MLLGIPPNPMRFKAWKNDETQPDQFDSNNDPVHHEQRFNLKWSEFTDKDSRKEEVDYFVQWLGFFIKQITLHNLEYEIPWKNGKY